jgi:flagella basal body P-ring formation protein FlgA
MTGIAMQNRTFLTRAIGVAALCGAGLVAGSAAEAQTRAQDAAAAVPGLRREAMVESDVVTLGDLVDHCGAACARPLFRAPAPGETGTIQALRVVAAARDAGLSEVETRGLRQVVISRAGRAATREEIEGALTTAIGPRVGLAATDLQVTLDQGSPRISLAPGASDAPAVGDLVIDTRTRRFAATLASPRSRAVAARVSGAYAETVAAPVLTRSVQRGDSIRLEDIAIERRERDAVGDEQPANPGQLAGRVSRTALRAGTVLRERDLVKPLIVDRNSAVTMTFESGSLQLSLRGKAIEQGAMGDVINVQNLASKRVVQGVVTGPGMVRVHTSASAAVARAAAD